MFKVSENNLVIYTGFWKLFEKPCYLQTKNKNCDFQQITQHLAAFPKHHGFVNVKARLIEKTGNPIKKKKDSAWEGDGITGTSFHFKKNIQNKWLEKKHGLIGRLSC